MRAVRWALLLATTMLAGILGCGQRPSSATPATSKSPGTVAATSPGSSGFTLSNVSQLEGGTTNVVMVIREGRIVWRAPLRER